MNFSSGSRAPRSNYTPKSGYTGDDFRFAGLKSAGLTTNAGAAADAVSTSAIYNELRQNAPDYQKMAGVIEGLALAEREVLDWQEKHLKE